MGNENPIGSQVFHFFPFQCKVGTQWHAFLVVVESAVKSQLTSGSPWRVSIQEMFRARFGIACLCNCDPGLPAWSPIPGLARAHPAYLLRYDKAGLAWPSMSEIPVFYSLDNISKPINSSSLSLHTARIVLSLFLNRNIALAENLRSKLHSWYFRVWLESRGLFIKFQTESSTLRSLPSPALVLGPV